MSAVSFSCKPLNWILKLTHLNKLKWSTYNQHQSWIIWLLWVPWCKNFLLFILLVLLKEMQNKLFSHLFKNWNGRSGSSSLQLCFNFNLSLCLLMPDMCLRVSDDKTILVAWKFPANIDFQMKILYHLLHFLVYLCLRNRYINIK